MNPNIILQELDIIHELLVNIKNEENEEAIDFIIDKIELLRRYL